MLTGDAINMASHQNAFPKSKLPKKQALEMAYKQHLVMACLAYMKIRTKLMPCNLESEGHLGWNVMTKKNKDFD